MSEQNHVRKRIAEVEKRLTHVESLLVSINEN